MPTTTTTTTTRCGEGKEPTLLRNVARGQLARG